MIFNLSQVAMTETLISVRYPEKNTFVSTLWHCLVTLESKPKNFGRGQMKYFSENIEIVADAAYVALMGKATMLRLPPTGKSMPQKRHCAEAHRLPDQTAASRYEVNCMAYSLQRLPSRPCRTGLVTLNYVPRVPVRGQKREAQLPKLVGLHCCYVRPTVRKNTLSQKF